MFQSMSSQKRRTTNTAPPNTALWSHPKQAFCMTTSWRAWSSEDSLSNVSALSQNRAWYWLVDAICQWNTGILSIVETDLHEISLSGSCLSIHHGFFSKVTLINKNGISGFLLSLQAWVNAQTSNHFLSLIDTCWYAQVRPTADGRKVDSTMTCLRLKSPEWIIQQHDTCDIKLIKPSLKATTPPTYHLSQQAWAFQVEAKSQGECFQQMKPSNPPVVWRISGFLGAKLSNTMIQLLCPCFVTVFFRLTGLAWLACCASVAATEPGHNYQVV